MVSRHTLPAQRIAPGLRRLRERCYFTFDISPYSTGQRSSLFRTDAAPSALMLNADAQLYCCHAAHDHYADAVFRCYAICSLRFRAISMPLAFI